MASRIAVARAAKRPDIKREGLGQAIAHEFSARELAPQASKCAN